MSYAGHLMEDYFRRTGRPGASALDAAYQYQTTVLLERLEVVLDDEHVPEVVIQRVLRCMLYGSPSVAAAELRIEQAQQITDLLARVPPLPVRVPSAVPARSRQNTEGAPRLP